MAIATVVYPVQQAALIPGQIATSVGEFFDTRAELRGENTRLKADLLQASLRTAGPCRRQAGGRERLQKLLQMSQAANTSRHRPVGSFYLGATRFAEGVRRTASHPDVRTGLGR